MCSFHYRYFDKFLVNKSLINKSILLKTKKYNDGQTDFSHFHPLKQANENVNVDWKLTKICVVIVIATGPSFFAPVPFGISTEWVALFGATILIILGG